jgi:hypothetical protein
LKNNKKKKKDTAKGKPSERRFVYSFSSNFETNTSKIYSPE